jgi:hypothetical protein
MCVQIDQVYQGYLVTAQKDKGHNMGPPTIHRGFALLQQVMKMEQSLAQKDGLKAMWPVVKAALETIQDDDTELDEAQSIIGHCKISTMFDKQTQSSHSHCHKLLNATVRPLHLAASSHAFCALWGLRVNLALHLQDFLTANCLKPWTIIALANEQLDMCPSVWGLLDTCPRSISYAHHGHGCHSMRI